jgi:hypothetical protein
MFVSVVSRDDSKQGEVKCRVLVLFVSRVDVCYCFWFSAVVTLLLLLLYHDDGIMMRTNSYTRKSNCTSFSFMYDVMILL